VTTSHARAGNHRFWLLSVAPGAPIQNHHPKPICYEKR
jgi:hypothetical protein